MTGPAGTGALVRLALRRDRVLLLVWIAVFAAIAAVSAKATVGLYTTEQARVQAAEMFNHTKSLTALYGKVYDPTSAGALAMVKLGGSGAVMVAVLAILLVVRHTRAEEETGRLELVAATVVGRHAPLTAAIIIALVANVALGVCTAAALVGAGLPADGSLVFGLSWASVGIAFAAIAAITTQVSSRARAARGFAIAVLGVVYVLRAVGDTASESGPRWVGWLSPIGWGQQFRPYAGNRWWVVLITTGFAAVAVAAAYLLAARRDLGAGLVREHPGPATGPRLRGPLSLAWRLQRGSLLAWASGFALLGAVFGNIASSVGDFFDSPAARDMVMALGGEKGLTDAFLATELGLVALIAAAYGITSAMRLRAEETASRAEPVLAAAVGRTRWALSHLVVALGGTTVLMVVLGLSVGFAHGARVGDLGQVGRVLGGALAQLPAIWVLVGVVVAGFGLLPRISALGWVVLVAVVVLSDLGPLLELDQWVMGLSPFTHLPKLPGSDWTLTPLLGLSAIAALMNAAGLAGFRRRDLG
ncbi:ABC-2 type transport system permease protein [Actinokineospora alba]|uniref:ABC-2 type transport system permease protein n=1 Tax=Actinokineospora alba TaxID=504798 RepID=A0A1H0FM95_9PSEU|nr:ABC transporter permease [Actinokineospora alba]TDP69532.1 ABC-2 type transport system permease protein [Actinokineospora alba]SDI14770.1 ABC-2 type transport system permease protein [Actinokineospora alba]SDN95662.1 ABC-2 type transport system permease protein [Actinokineospora alba]